MPRKSCEELNGLRPAAFVRGAVAVSWLCAAAVALLAIVAPAAGRSDRATRPVPPVTGHQDPLYCPPFLSQAPAPMSPEALLAELRDLHSAARHHEALKVAEELVRLVPDRPIGHYNHACVLARLRRIDEAMAALERAVDLGWRNTAHVVIDFDLDPIRRDERFTRILERLQRLAADERLVPAPLRTDPVAEVVEDLRDQAPALLERYHVPGAAIALVRDGRVVWEGGCGVGDRAGGAAILASSRFTSRAANRLLSLIALLEQQQRGRLDLLATMRQVADEAATTRTLAAGGARSAPPSVGISVVARSAPGRSQTRTTTHRDQREPAPRTTAERVDDLLRLITELAGEEPVTVQSRRFLARAGARSTILSVGDDDQPAVMVVGHTELGTPLRTPPADEQPTVITTAADLGRVVAAMMDDRPHDAAAPGASSLSDLLCEVAQLDAAVPGGLGLPARITHTRWGPCLEVTDEQAGTGCLMRWYPREGAGVVILYNSAGGAEAARRIAHVALGGG